MIWLREATIPVMLALIVLMLPNSLADSAHKVIRVPDDYGTITLAVNAASPEDTILVAEGTYFEHLVIEKPLSLVGANCSSIVDGYGSGTVMYISASNVNVTGFTIRNSSLAYPRSAIFLEGCSGVNIVGNLIRDLNGYSVLMRYSSDNSIVNNSITNNDYGIQIESSYNNSVIDNEIFCNRYGIGIVNAENNVVADNSISYCFEGIELDSSSGNLLRNNKMLGNTFNFGVVGDSLSDFINDVDISNKVDDKPIYYWINQDSKQVPDDAGYVAVVNSTNITVRDLALKWNVQGLVFAFTNNSVIENVDATWNFRGIDFLYSNKNKILRANITRNDVYGILVLESDDNIFEGSIVEFSNVCSFQMEHSNCNKITNNTIASSVHCGIALVDCDRNLIIDNALSTNERGLVVCRSPHNLIARNQILSNDIGIQLMYPEATANTIQDNTIRSNDFGIDIEGGVRNILFHNNLVNNAHHVTSGEELNAWDNGVEGNYWNEYNGTDIDQDGIGDSPYTIDAANKDQHPLMSLYATAPPTIPSDLNKDGIVDIRDCLKVANAFGSCPGYLHYDINIDANQDLTIDIFDIIMFALNFGKNSAP